MSKIQIKGFPTTIPFNITIGDASTDTLTVAGPILGSAAGLTYVAIGDAGTTSHAFNANDDLFVAGKFECDGLAEFDGSVDVYSGPLYFGGISSSSPAIVYNVVQTPDSPILGVGQSSRAWIICENSDAGYDFAHVIQTNPTLFIQSANQSATQWISIAHDQTNGVINVGVGDLDISGAAKIIRPNQIGITAASAGTQGGSPLTKSVNNITAVTTACNCVTLPVPVTGAMLWVMNSGANTLQIWPATGCNLGAGANAGKTLAAAKQGWFMGISATEWVPLLGANLL